MAWGTTCMFTILPLVKARLLARFIFFLTRALKYWEIHEILKDLFYSNINCQTESDRQSDRQSDRWTIQVLDAPGGPYRLGKGLLGGGGHKNRSLKNIKCCESMPGRGITCCSTESDISRTRKSEVNKQFTNWINRYLKQNEKSYLHVPCHVIIEQTENLTDSLTDRQMDNPTIRCPWRTFQAGKRGLFVPSLPWHGHLDFWRR